MVRDSDTTKIKLDKVLKTLNATLVDDLSIPAPPPSIPASELRAVPPSTYRVLSLDPPLADLEKVKKKLEAKGYSGTIKFSSQAAADIYDLFLLLELNTLGLDVGAELDTLFEVTADYAEHLTSTSGAYFLPRTMDHLNVNGVRTHTSTTTGAWELEGDILSGAGVSIAIIDVGFASGNYDITGWDPVRRVYPGTNRDPAAYDFVQDDRNVDHADCYNGSCWHGTKSAAMAAGGRNNHYGTAGVAPQATLLLFRVGTGGINFSYAGEAVRRAIAWGADVISMSFGGWYVGCNDWYAYFNDALREAESAGIVSVAAAGNDNTATGKSCVSIDRNFLPGAWSQVISVGAHDRAKNRSIWTSTGSASNYGPIAQVWAPGGGGSTRSYGRKDLPSAPTPSDPCYSADRCVNDPTSNSSLRYTYAGTSAATPAVAGVVALMKDYRASLTKTQALSILQTTAVSSPSDSAVTDAVNAEAALRHMGAR